MQSTVNDGGDYWEPFLCVFVAIQTFCEFCASLWQPSDPEKIAAKRRKRSGGAERGT